MQPVQHAGHQQWLGLAKRPFSWTRAAKRLLEESEEQTNLRVPICHRKPMA